MIVIVLIILGGIANAIFHSDRRWRLGQANAEDPNNKYFDFLGGALIMITIFGLYFS